jgi:hypothetical protein
MAQPVPLPARNAEMIETASGIAAALKEFKGGHAEHLRLLKQVDKLRILLETPMDVLMKQWETAQCIAAINLLVEMGVLEAIPKEGSITAKELAGVIGIDESAICRWEFSHCSELLKALIMTFG